MKVTVTRVGFLSSLKKVSTIVDKDPILPELESVLIEAQTGVITLRTSNLEVECILHYDLGQTFNQGRILVPCNIFIKLFSMLEGDEVSIELKNKMVVVSSDEDGIFEIPNEQVDNFPHQKTFLDGGKRLGIIKADAKELSKALKSSYAVSSDEYRPAMTCVYMDVVNDKIVTTDAHQLTCIDFSFIAEGDFSELDILLRKEFVQLFDKLKLNGQVVMEFSKDSLKLSGGGLDGGHVTSTISGSKYPNYECVIPKQHKVVANVYKSDLVKALKKVALFSNKVTQQVIIDIKEGDMQISAMEVDFGFEAKANIHCTLEGDTIKLGYNAQFLLQALNHLEGDTVALEMIDSKKPTILKGSNESYFILVMPVILKEE